MRRWLIFTCLLIILLSGCRRQEKAQTIRVITGITVTAAQGPKLTTKHFTDNRDLEIIMNYLRRLDPYNTTGISPDSFRTDAYEIIVSYSDGNHAVYHQIYDQYFQISDGSWRRIDPAQGGKLPGILGQLLQR